MVSRVVSVVALVLVASVLPNRSVGADPICAEDIRKLCADVPPGGGRIQACLEKHESDLSKDCRARVGDLVKEAGLLGVVCRWDITRFCTHIAPGGARIVSCLSEHPDDISLECKAELDKASK